MSRQRLPISVLENVVSNAERRALRSREAVAVPRVLDLYAALPSITGKLELEYEGELKGGDAVARELIRARRRQGLHTSTSKASNVAQIVQWFDLGGSLKLDEGVDSAAHGAAARRHSGADGEDRSARPGAPTNRMRVRASAAEFILEGLYAHRRISRNEERGFAAEEKQRREPREREENAKASGRISAAV